MVPPEPWKKEVPHVSREAPRSPRSPRRAGSGRPRLGSALSRDIAQLENRLDRLDNTRRISGREEQRLDRSIAGLKRTWSAYSRGGFSPAERRNLSAHIIRVQRDLDRQANDRNDRARNRGW